MEGIVMVSTGEAGLSQKTLDQIQSIHTSIHIQAFVTPT
jgi:hypothetical protein